MNLADKASKSQLFSKRSLACKYKLVGESLYIVLMLVGESSTKVFPVYQLKLNCSLSLQHCMAVYQNPLITHVIIEFLLSIWITKFNWLQQNKYIRKTCDQITQSKRE